MDEYDSANNIVDENSEKIENKQLKEAAKFGKKLLNIAKKGLEATGKVIVAVAEESGRAAKDHYDGMKAVRDRVRKEVEKSLLEDVKDIDISLYSESRTFFKTKERDLKNSLIAFAMNKDADELTKDEKEKIKDVIEKFPESEEIGEEADLLQDSQIAHFLFGKFIDLGDINYKKMADVSKQALDTMVADQTLIIQDGFKSSFNIWLDKLISKIEKEITSLNPDLVDWSKEKLRLENDLKELEKIESTISNSEEMLDKLLSA